MPIKVRGPAPANDNAFHLGAPEVRTSRTSRGRAKVIYARSENVLLPLRFAARMPGWQVRPAGLS
ncbi:MAG TPA: hypothetical protein VHG72_09980 [Polyangia bacterium]|nr:hypothetical protein [Polyangia bacterium]